MQSINNSDECKKRTKELRSAHPQFIDYTISEKIAEIERKITTLSPSGRRVLKSHSDETIWVGLDSIRGLHDVEAWDFRAVRTVEDSDYGDSGRYSISYYSNKDEAEIIAILNSMIGQILSEIKQKYPELSDKVKWNYGETIESQKLVFKW